MAKARIPAIAYLRTSSAANVGTDKDSDTRQRAAIEAFAKRVGYELVGEFYDAAVSGADPIEQRPGFAAMLERIEANGVRTIIVETANRFARDLMVQEVGYQRLRKRTVREGKDAKPDPIHLIAADSPSAFLDDGPTSRLIRQVLGAVAEFDKAMTVAKLRGARERRRRQVGKCEGRKSHAEKRPEVVAEAKRLHRASPKTGERRSLRKIAAELAALGHVNVNGRPYSAKSVRSMIEGPARARQNGRKPTPVNS